MLRVSYRGHKARVLANRYTHPNNFLSHTKKAYLWHFTTRHQTSPQLTLKAISQALSAEAIEIESGLSGLPVGAIAQRTDIGELKMFFPKIQLLG